MARRARFVQVWDGEDWRFHFGDDFAWDLRHAKRVYRRVRSVDGSSEDGFIKRPLRVLKEWRDGKSHESGS